MMLGMAEAAPHQFTKPSSTRRALTAPLVLLWECNEYDMTGPVSSRVGDPPQDHDKPHESEKIRASAHFPALQALMKRYLDTIGT
jgi:hypothetical protein